jgi:hypothetical protein
MDCAVRECGFDKPSFTATSPNGEGMRYTYFKQRDRVVCRCTSTIVLPSVWFLIFTLTVSFIVYLGTKSVKHLISFLDTDYCDIQKEKG